MTVLHVVHARQNKSHSQAARLGRVPSSRRDALKIRRFREISEFYGQILPVAPSVNLHGTRQLLRSITVPDDVLQDFFECDHDAVGRFVTRCEMSHHGGQVSSNVR